MGILEPDVELANAAKSLANSEERYRLLIDGLSVGIWDWIIPTNDLYWSSRYKEIVCSDTELKDTYEEWEDRLHPEDKNEVVSALSNHLNHRIPYDVEYRLRRDDGNYIWIHAKGKAMWNVDGKPVRMVGSIEDISWRKQIEENIKSETIRLTAVMNTVLDGLITINHQGIIHSFNRSAERIFGYTPEEVIGQNVKMLMPEPYRGGHDGYLTHYMDTGERKVIGIGREVVGQRKDGTTFPMELGINEMRMGEERMFVGTVRDITQRKESEAAIQQYVEKLKRSNQELDDFAHIASHDLKEPIRGLTNNAIFIMEDHMDKLEESGKKRLNRMVYLCKRMEQLVDDLLYFSRLGRQELAVQQANLNFIISDIALMMETTLIEKNVSILIPKTLPPITCDVPRVTEVFRNLITNAVKYNKSEEKTVEIGALEEKDSNVPVFYVRDNGIGIEDRFYNDIFRIFKRLNEEDDSAKGTGVGLTFVKKIIERHGGKIWLESKPEAGTTFYFTLRSEEGA